MLTAFFKLFSEDDFARKSRWNQVTKQETVVESYPDLRKTDALGKVYVVHANGSECFHLRILLHVVKGPTSFISVRTFEDITYEKFQGFCKAIYLLEDDTHWESTLYESVLCCSAKSLAHIFFGKIIAKAWLNIYCIAELSSNNLDFDQNILMKLYLN